MSSHSKLPPSSAARRVICPGSKALEEPYRGEQSQASREGEAAHWLAAWSLSAVKTSDKDLFPPEFAPNGEFISDEMIQGAELYQKHVFDICAYRPDDLHVEEKIDISIIHPDCWGTPDCWYFENNVMHLWDYKFGHKFVDPFQNWQMIEYCAGILEYIRIYKSTNIDIKIYCHIVQPRSYDRLGPIRTWETSKEKLQSYFIKLQEAETLASQPIALCHPSPECTNCSARSECPALQKSCFAILDIMKLNTSTTLKPKDAGYELKNLEYAFKLLEARITGLKQEVISHIEKGESVPFFNLTPVIGREKWSVKTEEILQLGELFGVDLKKDITTVTPKQAVAAGIPSDVVKQYSEVSKSLKLTMDDGKTTRRIFNEN